jgi:hypothetical protein
METLPTLPISMNGNGHVHLNGKHGQTGPKSPAGKQRSSLNSVTHGLHATDDIFVSSLNAKQQAAYRKIRRGLYRFYDPVTVYEKLLVDRMAVQHLRMLRLYRFESIALDTLPLNLGSDRGIFPHLDRFSRYDVRLERQLRILHNRLISLQIQRENNQLKSLPRNE